MSEDDISGIIIGKAIEVHKALGPGLLESAYRQCLHYELKSHGLLVESEKPMPVVYKGLKLDQGYRMDLLVEDKVVNRDKDHRRVHQCSYSPVTHLPKTGQL